jgi:hypothetical protein
VIHGFLVPTNPQGNVGWVENRAPDPTKHVRGEPFRIDDRSLGLPSSFDGPARHFA